MIKYLLKFIIIIYPSLVITGFTFYSPPKLQANQFPETHSHAYMQLGMGLDALTYLYISQTQYDSNLKKDVTTNNNGIGSLNLNPIFILGWYVFDWDAAIYVKYGRSVTYQNKINGNETAQATKSKAYISFSYFFLNYRKNFMHIYNNIVYAGVGAGFAYASMSSSGSQSSANKQEAAGRFGLGIYRKLTSNIDIDLGYNYKVNFATKALMENAVRQLIRLQTHSIVLSFRLNL